MSNETTPAAKSGDTVTIEFTATLNDGREIAQTDEAGETFTIGEGRLFLAVEEALVGMNEGETKKVDVPAAEGFGERSQELLFQAPRDRMPPDIDLQPGLELSAKGPDGQPIRLVVRAVEGDSVTLDGNHPFAGEDVTFNLKLREIVSPAG